MSRLSTSKLSNHRQVRRFELLSITPVTGWQAVFAQESEKHEGKFYLFSGPVYMMGVAKVLIDTYVDDVCVKTDDGGNQIVALTHDDGYFEIADDAENFAGVCRDGEDIYEATRNLSSNYTKNLVREEQ